MSHRNARPKGDWPLVFVLAVLLILVPIPFGGAHGWAFHLIRLSLVVLSALILLTRSSERGARTTPADALGRSLRYFTLIGIATILLVHHALALSLRRGVVFKLLPSPALDTLIWLAELALTALASYRLISRGRWNLAVSANAIIVSGVMQALLGLSQRFAGVSAILGVPNTWNPGASFGTFVNPDHFSGYLEMTLPLCFGYIATRARRLPKESSLKERILFLGQDVFQKSILYMLAALIMALGIIFSRCRTGFIVLLASFFVLALASGRQGWSRKWISAFLVLLCLLGFWSGFDPLYKKFTQSASDRSLEFRFTIWNACMGIVKDHPWIGIGPDALPSVITRYESPDTGFRNEYAHSAYVQAAVDYGLLGFGMWILLALGWTASLWKEWQTRHHPFARGLGAGCLAGILSMYLHGVTDFCLSIPAIEITFVFLFVIGFAAVRNRET